MIDKIPVYKESISFKSIFYFCSLPLRIDSYKGCTFNCLYCFSQSLNNRSKDFFHSTIQPADPIRLERLLKNSESKNLKVGVVQSCFNRRIPIHLGGVSDPFQQAEMKYKITLDYIKILRKYNYPTVISTKGTMVSNQEYLSLIIDFPVIVQNSFSSFNDKLAAKLEPGAPSPSDRLRSLEKLSKSGVWTSIRIQPFIFPFMKPDDIDFKSLASAGVKHVVLEHLRIPTNSKIESREKLFIALGMNMIDEYRRLGIQISRINYELASDQKIKNIEIIRNIVHNCGMTFGSADNDFHHISDLPCCCGLPDQKEFQNYYKGHLGYSAYNSIRSGKVSFDNIEEEWQPSGSIAEFLNENCRLTGLKTPSDYLRNRIESNKNSNSPVSFVGIECDNESAYHIDKNFRNIIFKKED